MARLRIMPHRTAATESVEWGAWWVRIEGRRMPLEERLPSWDYATPAVFELQPSVNADLVAATTGISDPSLIDLAVLLDCRATGQRFLERRNVASFLQADTNIVTVEPPVGSIADEVHLSAHLVLNRSIEVRDLGTAYRAGSRLGSSVTATVRLEGDQPRFPTEALSFTSLGLEPAAWTLQLNFNDLEESFMGGVRLLVNTDHPAAEALLDDSVAGSPQIQSVLRMDVARQLILNVALDQSLHLTSNDSEEGSVRAVLESLCEIYLGSGLPAVVELARTDLLRFERKLQGGFELFRGTS